MSTPRRLVGGALGRTGSALKSASMRVRGRSERERTVAEWFARHGDETLRLEYPLDPSSIVFDLGGYVGQWASDVYARYRSQIWVFEPMPVYAEHIRGRFALNPDIRVFSFGLGATDETILLSESGDESSVFKSGRDSIEGHLRQADAFLAEQHIDHVDLMKINIEGGEYDLLDHLIAGDHAERITDLQVQFHDFVPDAQDRMEAIQSALARTHELTYQYPFVWENWRRR